MKIWGKKQGKSRVKTAKNGRKITFPREVWKKNYRKRKKAFSQNKFKQK
jgi:hypothetical protein